MRNFWQDIRFGLRMLRRSPGFSALVIAILAIGIGSTTMLLSVVDAVMLRPCPYKDSDRLVCVDETNLPEKTKSNFTSLAGFRDLRDQQRVFAPLVGANQWNGMVRTADRYERTRAYLVSENFFSTLGAEFLLGRTFSREDYGVDAGNVAVIGYDHWQRWFGGDPAVIGKTMVFDNQVNTVIGVLSKDFRWIFQGVACGLWMPLSLERIGDWRREYRALQAIGRLKPGVSIAQAQAEMDLIAERLARAYPEANAKRGLLVTPINDYYARMNVRSGKPRTLLILLVVVSSVLLIACLHVASLMIARASTREREIAVRAALGAHRRRLMRQLLTESALLGVLGGVLGAILTHWGLRILAVARGQSIPWYLGYSTDRLVPYYIDITMNARTFLYVTLMSLLTCFVFGVLPALGASRVNLNRSLSAGRLGAQIPRFHGLRGILVTLDIAITLMLLVAGGLLVNSYLRVLSIDLRYNAHHTLTAKMAFDWRHAPESTERLAVFEEAVRRMHALPAVRSVSAATYHPVTGSFSTPPFQLEASTAGQDTVDIPQTEVFPDYFRLLQIPLLQGRAFTEHDDKATSPKVIVNEAMAQRFWPGESVIGKYVTCIRRGKAKPVPHQIVGVAGNVWHSRYTSDEPELYIPYLQTDYSPELYLMIHTASDSRALRTVIRKTLMSLSDEAVVSEVALIRERFANLYATERANMLLLSAFACMGLLLASIGVYGSTAYMVSRRTQEIGIRMALGACTGDVLRITMVQGSKLICIGVTLGLVGSLAATRVIRSLLHDISPTDPLTFTCVSLLLTGVALLACYLPARRAARIDPMEALRYE